MKNRALCYFALLTLAWVSFIILIFYLSVDNNDKPESVQNIWYRSSSVRIDSLLESTPIDSVKSKLTNAKYFLSRNIHDYTSLSNDLSTLDSLYPGNSLQIRTEIFSVLTDSYKAHLSSALDTFNFAELLNLQNFQIRYYYYEQVAVNPNEKLMLNSINLFWGNYIANKLAEYSRTYQNLKFGFQYRFLESRSKQYDFGVNRKVSSLEKVVINLLSSNWGHLFNSSWNQASLVQKMVFLSLFILTILSYTFSLNLLFKRLIKKK